MTDRDPNQIAAGLTEAQRTALLMAKIPPPTNMLPNYRMMDMPNCGMSAFEADELQVMGLVSLPIRQGDRTSTISYSGEIHPIGLAVRAIIERDSK